MNSLHPQSFSRILQTTHLSDIELALHYQCYILKTSGLESNVGGAKSEDGVMVGGTLASTYVLCPSQMSMSLISN